MANKGCADLRTVDGKAESGWGMEERRAGAFFLVELFTRLK